MDALERVARGDDLPLAGYAMNMMAEGGSREAASALERLAMPHLVTLVATARPLATKPGPGGGTVEEAARFKEHRAAGDRVFPAILALEKLRRPEAVHLAIKMAGKVHSATPTKETQSELDPDAVEQKDLRDWETRICNVLTTLLKEVVSERIAREGKSYRAWGYTDWSKWWSANRKTCRFPQAEPASPDPPSK